MAKDYRTYREKLLDPRWQRKRLEVLNREHFRCESCQASEKTLHVHHGYYRKGAEGPWDCDAVRLRDYEAICRNVTENEETGEQIILAVTIDALVKAQDAT